MGLCTPVSIRASTARRTSTGAGFIRSRLRTMFRIVSKIRLFAKAFQYKPGGVLILGETQCFVFNQFRKCFSPKKLSTFKYSLIAYEAASGRQKGFEPCGASGPMQRATPTKGRDPRMHATHRRTRLAARLSLKACANAPASGESRGEAHSQKLAPSTPKSSFTALMLSQCQAPSHSRCQD